MFSINVLLHCRTMCLHCSSRIQKHFSSVHSHLKPIVMVSFEIQFAAVQRYEIYKWKICPLLMAHTYGPHLVLLDLFGLLWQRKKNLLLSLWAFLIFAAFSLSSDPVSLLTLGGLQVNWTQITVLRGQRASGAHAKLKPHWSQWCEVLSCVPWRASLSVSASSVFSFLFVPVSPTPFPFLASKLN